MKVRKNPELPAVFAAQDAYDAGISRYELRGRGLQKIGSGTWLSPGAQPTLQEQIIARSRAIRNSVIASVSAAQFYGLRLPARLENTSTFYLHANRQIRRHNTVALRSQIDPADINTYQDFRITNLQRTFLDLGRELNVTELIYVADGLFAYHRAVKPGAAVIQREVLCNYIESSKHHRGKAVCMEALARAVVGSDSHKETELRLLFEEHGISGLVANPVIRDDLGRYLFEPDLADFIYRISFQYEGAHHGTLRQRQRDEERRERTLGAGWVEVKIFASDLYEQVWHDGVLIPRAVQKALLARQGRVF